jgi:spoIIIJ-associated protein
MSDTALDPKETLDTMLGLLGFITEIKEFPHDHGLTLQVYTGERERLIGRNGTVLEDIQLLLNRVLQSEHHDAPKVQVDVEHWREMKDDHLAHKVQQLAEIVRKTGRPFQLEPMNAYERRIVHNAFKDDPEVMSWSPQDDARIKRITLKRRVRPGQA